jgi:prophage regulatory protein
MADNNSTEWLTVEQVAHRFSVSSATIWRWVRERRFPDPIRIGPRSTRWRRADIEDVEARLAGTAA